LSGLIIYLPLFPEVHYGDKIIVQGWVSGNKLLKPEIIDLVSSKGILFSLRGKIISFFQKNLPEPHASLLAGITLGYKSALPEEFWNNLKVTGTAHVVVASGMNVAFVAAFLLGVFILIVPRKKAIVFVLIGIWLYCVLAGLEAPIVRAGIMASLTFLAQEYGRLSSTFRVLILTALVMLAVNPFWLTDLGFILTFVSTASLMLFSNKIQGWLKSLPKVFRESLSTSLAAQIGVGPILFVTFGQFNILSPLINALILWTVPILMFIGSVAGIISLIWPWLAKFVLYLAFPLTWWFIKITQIMSFQ
jgi:competence protein ComEC